MKPSKRAKLEDIINAMRAKGLHVEYHPPTRNGARRTWRASAPGRREGWLVLPEWVRPQVPAEQEDSANEQK